MQDTTSAYSAESLYCALDSLAQRIGPPLRWTHLWTGLGTYNNYTLRGHTILSNVPQVICKYVARMYVCKKYVSPQNTPPK